MNYLRYSGGDGLKGQKDKKAMDITIEQMVDRICAHLPAGYKIKLCLESGAAWVTLVHADGRPVILPDTTDKTLIEQLNDALCVANGWHGE